MAVLADKNGLGGEAMRDAIAMVSVFPEYLMCALGSIKAEYGSVYGYLKNALGVSDKDMERLQDRFLEV